jgi:starch synthase (maltosyl-transferring)
MRNTTNATAASGMPSALVARAARPARIYYLHPLLAGHISNWPAHFARIAAMDFSHVLLAPPFLPGRSGDIFLTADHRRINPLLGDGLAVDRLAQAVEAARGHGLDLLLDLVADRVAAECGLASERPDWIDLRSADAPPDPRMPPELAFAGTLRFDRDLKGLSDWWTERLGEWTDTGIAGFRCERPHHAPSLFWQQLIRAVRHHAPDTMFIAWALGTMEAQSRELAKCGFDFAASSSWAWDFRASWLNDDTRRMNAIAPLIAMPELPFGHRLPEAAMRRALPVAAGFGAGWLLPMGCEFGALTPLDPARGDPQDFARLMDNPTCDLTDTVRAANALNRRLAPHMAASVISAPGQDMASLLRKPAGAAAEGAVILANAELDHPAAIHATQLLTRSDGQHALCDESGPVPVETRIDLPPAGSRILFLQPVTPILRPAPANGAAAPDTAAPRIAIEAVTPIVDNGRFAVKRQVGDIVRVEADIVSDGHGVLGVALLWRAADEASWQEIRMTPLGNDRYTAEFPLSRLGPHAFIVEAWVDSFATFRDELTKKHAAGLSLALELREGRDLVRAQADRNTALIARIDAAEDEALLAMLLSEDTAAMMAQADPRPFRSRTMEFPVEAERQAANFASWYELFPRSQSGSTTRHGTFHDVIARLPAIRDMGFDVLYLTPIHPIGTTHRKGRNNALRAGPDDLGSPYAIGGIEGGHDAIHPELGTLDDFRLLCCEAARHGLELALDFAIQCSPDHPWLRDHPDWFDWRADGTIRYAENPPKKYEDIVSADFYAAGATPSLWIALRDVVLFWVREGVRIFRVDNPHTKPFPFWEWLIADIRGQYPDVIFLSEAFTRPKVMYRLAKLGFSQSYTYFTWRNTAQEFREYLTELTTTAPREFFRPNFFVNTPDINPVFLQTSGRPGFLIRAALATTLSGLWGMYSGFELCESLPLPGREEYLNSEKYEIRVRDWNQPGNIIAEIARLNTIRRSNPALQTHLGLTLLSCSNNSMLCFAKTSAANDNMVIVAITMDPVTPQTGTIQLTPEIHAFAGASSVRLEDLMQHSTADWFGNDQQIHLDPATQPFAIWRVRPAFEG